jgi:hypothetical protein
MKMSTQQQLNNQNFIGTMVVNMLRFDKTAATSSIRHLLIYATRLRDSEEPRGKTHNSQLGIKFVTFKQSERKSNQTNKKTWKNVI